MAIDSTPVYMGPVAAWAKYFNLDTSTEFYTDTSGVVYYIDPATGVDYIVAGTLQELSNTLGTSSPGKTSPAASTPGAINPAWYFGAGLLLLIAFTK